MTILLLRVSGVRLLEKTLKEEKARLDFPPPKPYT